MISIFYLLLFWLMFDLPYITFRFIQLLVPLKTRDLKYRPRVTILVPAYNEERVIHKTLISCLKQTYPRLEIVVIDDGSKDNTSKVVSNFQKRYAREMKKRGIIFKHIKQKNSGKASAMNNGLANSRGEFVISIDADSYPHPSAVEKIMRSFTSEKIGAVAGHIIGVPRDRMLSYLQYVEYEFGFLFMKISQSSTSDVLITPGPFSAYRRKALIRFEDDTITEDFDTSIRIIERGYRIVEAPDAICYTQLPANVGDLIKQRVRWYQGGLQVFAKHFDQSKRYTAHFEMFLLFFYGFYGIMIRAVSLILIPLIFYWETGSALLVLAVFLTYSFIIMAIHLLPVYRINRDYKMFLVIPFFILFHFSILLYACLVGQIRMFKNKVGWAKIRRYDHERTGARKRAARSGNRSIPYRRDFMFYWLKVAAVFVTLYFVFSFFDVYNVMLVIIASLFIAFTFRPLYLLSFLTSYLMFFYMAVAVTVVTRLDFLLLFVFLSSMMWNTFTVILYIKAEYTRNVSDVPAEEIAPTISTSHMQDQLLQ